MSVSTSIKTDVLAVYWSGAFRCLLTQSLNLSRSGNHSKFTPRSNCPIQVSMKMCFPKCSSHCSQIACQILQTTCPCGPVTASSPVIDHLWHSMLLVSILNMYSTPGGSKCHRRRWWAGLACVSNNRYALYYEMVTFSKNLWKPLTHLWHAQLTEQFPHTTVHTRSICGSLKDSPFEGIRTREKYCVRIQGQSPFLLLIKSRVNGTRMLQNTINITRHQYLRWNLQKPLSSFLVSPSCFSPSLFLWNKNEYKSKTRTVVNSGYWTRCFCKTVVLA